MLEGITVLNQTEIITPHPTAWVIGIMLGVGLVTLAAYLTKDIGCIGAFLGMFVGLIVLLLITIIWTTPSGRYEYECLIDESVSMTEVYERYEIIEQRGDIWVLEDKE